MTATDLAGFAVDLHQEILAILGSEEEDVLAPDAFTRYMISVLTEAGEIDDGEACYYQARGVEVSGYSFDEEESTLDLFVSRYTGAEPPTTIPKAEVEAGLRRLLEFFGRSRRGLHLSLEEASPAYDMAASVHAFAKDLRELRLFYLTDGLTTLAQVPSLMDGDLRVTSHVWDIQRLLRATTSGRVREPISVDFSQHSSGPVPCVKAGGGDGEYAAYLAVIPGQVLADIYDRFGPRLLERNVRSFLQARGKVNKEIRRTIDEQPANFLAFNNGITITASSVDLTVRSDGGPAIAGLTDMQIVNGGQTTASIHAASRRGQADLSGLSVAAKITVVRPDLLDVFVPRITRSANSQNKVSEADFSANDPFHVAVEQFSRTVWAPAVGGTQRQTKWFYERARGQYQDELAREATPARQRQFKTLYPTAQRFTKTDLAKFENSWACLPHTVSLGAEKNFRDFCDRLGRRGRFEVTQLHYQRLIAKAILFRQTQKLVTAQNFGGYRANTVAYSIAYLSYATSGRIDLDRIWKLQALPTDLARVLTSIAMAVREVIIRPPRGGNVTEWCKRKECWETVQALSIPELAHLPALLATSDDAGDSLSGSALDSPDPEEQALIDRIASVPAASWLALSHWAKETDNLQGWQRQIAYSLGLRAQRGQPPSRKQAVQAEKILQEAAVLGFAIAQDS